MPLALHNQLMGFTSKLLLHNNTFQHNQPFFGLNPISLPFHDTTRGTRLRRGPRFPVAAISQDFIKTTLRVHAEKPVQFKVRAVVTVRNKIREDFRDTMLKHLDAISDSIGTRNVVLELISTDIKPSKPFTTHHYYFPLSLRKHDKRI